MSAYASSLVGRVIAVAGDLRCTTDPLGKSCGWPVVEVVGMVQLTQLAQARRLAAVVYFGGRQSGVRGSDVVAAVGRCGCPLIACATADPVGYSDLISCALHGSGLHLLLENFADVADVVQRVCAAGPESSPASAILDRIVSRARPDLRAYIVGGICVGEKRTSVPRFVAACGRSDRTARGQLAAAGWPAPAAFPAWFTGVYIAYWTDILGHTLKHVARRAGFDSVDDLRRYLTTRTGRTPTMWRDLGFTQALDLLAAHLPPASAGRCTRSRR